MHPVDTEIARYTDHYFNRTKAVIGKFGDSRVTYAIFMRRPVICAPKLALDWLRELTTTRGTQVEIDLHYPEGKWVGAGEPMMHITGSFFHLVDLETIFLQKLGPACVAAYNAWTMCADMPKTAFLAMDARHCAGQEMAEMMAYAASVGSTRAKRKVGAVGFIGNATHATAHFFGRDQGLGTMPHALIGYAGSTLRAAEMFHETFPGEPMTVLVESYWQEIHAGLASYGIDVRHFVLHVEQDALRERIQNDAVLGPSTFRYEYVEPYAEAFRTWLSDDAEVIDTTHLSPEDTAQRIAASVST
jgi:nicotinate phosphoribosyltransferase